MGMGVQDECIVDTVTVRSGMTADGSCMISRLVPQNPVRMIPERCTIPFVTVNFTSGELLPKFAQSFMKRAGEYLVSLYIGTHPWTPRLEYSAGPVSRSDDVISTTA